MSYFETIILLFIKRNSIGVIQITPLGTAGLIVLTKLACRSPLSNWTKSNKTGIEPELSNNCQILFTEIVHLLVILFLGSILLLPRH